MTRLLVLGDLNLDIHAEEPAPTAPGQEVRAQVRATPGGSAGTFARVAARLGAEVTFLGAVGADLLGDLLERDLISNGVRPCLARSAAPTGVVLALRRAGDRSMICARGANDALDESALVPSLFAEMDHVHISGYALLSDRQAPAARRAVALARRAGIPTSLGVPPAALIEAHGTARFLRDAQGIDVLLLNLDEGRIVTGASEPGAVVDALAAQFQAGSLTLGARGAAAWRGPERASAHPVATLDVDPTGAGDAYAAAFVVHLCAGDSLQAIAQAGCDVALSHLAERASRLSSS